MTTYSNQHGFHYKQILQNTRALAPSHYALLSNLTALNPNVYDTLKQGMGVLYIELTQHYATAEHPHITTQAMENLVSIPVVTGAAAVKTILAPELEPIVATDMAEHIDTTAALPAPIVVMTEQPTTLERTTTLPTPITLATEQPSTLVDVTTTALPTPVATTEQPKASESATSNQNVIPLRAKKRMVWKVGRGAIEKVDKITGEIMHLVEEQETTIPDRLCA